MRRRFPLVLLLTALPALAAEVEIGTKDDARVVRAPGYEAVVAADGCLTNLRIGGAEFLAPGVSASRGSYLYQGGVLALPRVERTGRNVLLAKGEDVSVRYEFSPAGMEWTVRNRTREPVVLFLVLASDVEAGCPAGGAWERAPVTRGWPASAWARGDARLGLEGFDRVWGPWAGDHQVIEARVEAGTERVVLLAAGSVPDEERADLERLFDPFGGADLLLRSPQPWQVVQRRSRSEGEVLLSGCVRVEADAVEARVTGSPADGALPDDWLPLSLDQATRAFDARVVLPAGGWYRLEVRARRGDEVVARGTVEHFGVGEVFVGAGQSNSTNSGQFPTKQESGMVSAFDGERWVLAEDPVPGVHDRSGGGSFWPSFGDAMFERFGVPIGVAPTGHGGTSVNAWQPDGELFAWMMRRIEQLGAGGFRAVLWHQGESDVRMESDAYYRKLRHVIRESKARARWEFPWFVAQVSYHNPGAPRFDTTRSAQARLWAEGEALPGPDTDLLTGDHRDRDGKGIHFSPKGLRAHGRLWAEKVAPWLDGVLAR